ncbi:MAG: histidine kinase [Sphingobacteriales bacterium 17-39-43]|uniref:GAF domain-containing sensor histidine kinase n=1 Tax=Daejeonella sp. TaxID=2805397 RepID=UPI000BC724D2|nr:GAF domain-containing sensor histidine kinase [Daejeonella sp.]OYZ31166.1 MAG: histidine kinase [Sphingobacteriales bacterium 16-39-50]OZA24168.1 MAG: histidine kinase [Sphingobacteriales bacterium 17-39-43]HQT23215.1 GAF domain-containing sensor histidine kinase [Daejeonella sp.]HQT58167.1 GAF domain-containing sensor histidine kinase [Daejeonella sp.]
MNSNPPIPDNEFERVLNLTDYDLDYSNFQEKFKDLAKLAARVAGTPISLVNLIDSYTQWTVTRYGIDLEQMPREESVCQYLIATEDSALEVEDLSKDERFLEKFYVTGEEKLRYYYGIPLKSDGYNIGALCVMDREKRTLSPEKEELLKIIADEIVNRLKAYKAIEGLRNRVKEVQATQNKVVHDIRGPLGGIIGLTEIISEQGKENKIDEVLEFINLIHKSGKSILELADEILSAEKNKFVAIKGNEMDMQSFKEKLEKLYIPQAKSKNVHFEVNINPRAMGIPFPKNKLLQITGNLISNAIKFTPNGGRVIVGLDMDISNSKHNLCIKVQDSGEGLSPDKIDAILNGSASSEKGTEGEKGYGFGLQLIKHLISGLNGKLNISSLPGEGSVFEVMISGSAS